MQKSQTWNYYDIQRFSAYVYETHPENLMFCKMLGVPKVVSYMISIIFLLVAHKCDIVMQSFWYDIFMGHLHPHYFMCKVYFIVLWYE